MSPKEVKMCKIVEQISHSLFYVNPLTHENELLL